ncbi:MAG: sigma-70 family RNA polymerase sigma factor [Nannocystaceae bacterium]|nr:sigma-70 family RNA polymerase sigma factor [Nannocystaceae bacterium]
MIGALLERVYRREYGRVVSMLAARFGMQHMELVEDAVQSAWASALSTWPSRGVPDRPAAWLFRASNNAVLDRLRAQQRHAALALAGEDAPVSAASPEAWLAGEVRDAQLAMLFACCHDELPSEAQRILSLRILFGLTVAELAEHLFTTEANVYKRLQRARAKLQSIGVDLEVLTEEEQHHRMPAVRSILHLLFTGGYASVRADVSMRVDLCDEAIRLVTLLAERAGPPAPPTAALLALMFLHRARMTARDDGVGGLLLLSEQDRTLWDTQAIATGMRWLASAATGDTFSRYHAEAGIAAEHCRAQTFDETRWDRIVGCYALLERVAPSATHRLGHAIAIAQCSGPEDGLAFLQRVAPPSWLCGSFQWFAVLADLHLRCGHEADAARHRALALDAAPTAALRTLLERRLGPGSPVV